MALSLLSNGVLAFFLYSQFGSMQFQEMRSKALSVAATAATQVDGEKLAKVKTRADEKTPEYKAIVKQLRIIRDANRREDVYIKYVYTMMPDPKKPGGFLFGVDAEEKKSDIAHAGEESEGKLGVKLDIDKYAADERFTVDKWGVWLSAYAPVLGSDGRPVAALGSDLRATDVIEKKRRALWAAVMALAVSLTCAAVMSGFLANSVSRPLLKVRNAVEAIGKGDFETQVDIKAKDEFGAVAESVNAMATALREREMMKKIFARYISRQVAERILEPAEPGGRKITVLFSDLRGFDAVAEYLQPQAAVGMLNEFLGRAVEIVAANNGAVDKFIGHAMVSVFGTDGDNANQEKNAVRTAIEMRQELKRLCGKWELFGNEGFSLEAGINTGEAAAGGGFPWRMDFVAAGDAVNLAASLKSEAKKLGVDILMSETARVALGDEFDMKLTVKIVVKGRPQPVTVYAPA